MAICWRSALRLAEGGRTSPSSATATSRRKPLKLRKEDPKALAEAMYECLRLVDSLKILTYPYLPHSAEKLHGLMGYGDDI